MQRGLAAVMAGLLLSGCGVMNFRQYPDSGSWPKTVPDAVAALQADLSPAQADTIRTLKKADLGRLRPTLGNVIRDSLGLRRGNRDLFMSCGCMGMECCSSRIMAALWEKLQPQPLELRAKADLPVLQKRYPGIDLYLCGAIDDAHNFQASKTLWDFEEKSLCKEQAAAFSFRLVYWKAGKGIIVVRVDTAGGGNGLVFKKIKERSRSGEHSCETLLEKDQSLTAAAVDSLQALLRKPDWKTLSEQREGCPDSPWWRVEIAGPEGYGYYQLTCAHDKGLVELGNFLRDKIGLDYAID
jgi:hypothetical protein